MHHYSDLFSTFARELDYKPRREMKKKLAFLLQLWYVPSLLIFPLLFVGVNYHNMLGGLSYVCVCLSALLLLFQVVLLFVALSLRKWGGALCLFIIGFLLTLVVYKGLRFISASDVVDKEILSSNLQ